MRILDLYEELRDGHNLLLLLEMLCDIKLVGTVKTEKQISGVQCNVLGICP